VRAAPPKAATPAHRAKCEKVCNHVINHQLSAKYLDPRPFISDCIADCCLLGSFALIDGHKSAYFDKLRSIEKGLMSSVRGAEHKLKVATAASAKGGYSVQVQRPPAELVASVHRLRQEVNALRDRFGLGGARCPGTAPCFRRGTCGTNGCSCRTGWSGLDCNYSLQGEGYQITESVFTRQIAVPKVPIQVPPCKKATTAVSAGATQSLAQIQSVADATTGQGPAQGEGGEGPPGPPAGEGGEGEGQQEEGER